MAATQRAVSPPSDQPPATNPPRTPTSFPTDSHAPTTTSTGKADTLRPKHSNLGPTSNPRSLSPNTATSKPSQPRPHSRSPVPLTGAAAVAEAKRRDHQEQQQKAAAEGKRTSPNPAVQAMQALMGGGGMSRPSDSPAPNKLSEPMRKVAEKITIPSQTQGDSLHASPTSMSSYGSVESTGPGAAMTATASNFPETSGQHSYVAEPADMESGQYPENGHLNVNSDDGAKAFSYPGPPPQEAEKEAPSRGMSLPGYGQTSPKSPASSTKRHKCPYCSTDFTRHHNLKSHLLTHSQEKPYVCQTCNARFRRLHDLKRHTKLHTGERPHTCDKCGRRFARGDALARHNKGPGGCAGRRSSAGGEDDFGMDGVDYPGDEDDDVDMDPHARRVSEPSRKRAHLETPQDVERQVYRQHSSTYPPPAIPPHARGDMAPPQVVHPNAGAATSPRDMSGQPSPAVNSSYYNGSSAQVFPQQGPMMTESPKPLSPGQPSDQHRLSVTDPNAASSARNRSPSLASQLQQQHLSRASAGGGGRTPPQHPPAQQFPPHPAQPQLPPLTASSQRPFANPGPSSLHHQQIPPASASNAGSMSSHGRSSGSSLRDVLGSGSGSGASAGPEAPGAPPGPDIWAYVRGLEARFGRMQDEYELRISRMQEEIFALKAQVAGGGSGGVGGYGGGEAAAAAMQRH